MLHHSKVNRARQPPNPWILLPLNHAIVTFRRGAWPCGRHESGQYGVPRYREFPLAKGWVEAMRGQRWRIGILSMLLALGGTAVAGESVRITNGEWPPFTSRQLANGGLLSRIVAEAFALEGVTVEYGYFPWKRSYELAKSGRWDGSVGWAPSSEHRRDFEMSEPVIFVGKGLYHLKDTTFDWKVIDDLNRWRVGGTAGYSYGDEWDRAVKAGRLRIDEVTADEQSLRKLLLRRIDVIAMEVEVAEYLIQTILTPEEAAAIVRHPRLLTQAPICLALSRQSARAPGLLLRFNRGLQRLKDSGKYEQYVGQVGRGDRARKTQ